MPTEERLEDFPSERSRMGSSHLRSFVLLLFLAVLFLLLQQQLLLLLFSRSPFAAILAYH
jgi:hypothetical protein